MSLKQQVNIDTPTHGRLLAGIAELAYVPQALAQQTAFVKDLQTQLSAGEDKLKALSKKTEQERLEHEKLRDSVMRRFAYKATGRKDKYETKASKEEKYFPVHR